MKKYEYKVVTIPPSFAMSTKQYEKIIQEFEAKLNELGADGWELIQRIDGLFSSKEKANSLKMIVEGENRAWQHGAE